MIELKKKKNEKETKKIARNDPSVHLLTAMHSDECDLLHEESDLILYYEQVFVSFISLPSVDKREGDR